jgi:hypothetical protein
MKTGSLKANILINIPKQQDLWLFSERHLWREQLKEDAERVLTPQEISYSRRGEAIYI